MRDDAAERAAGCILALALDDDAARIVADATGEPVVRARTETEILEAVVAGGIDVLVIGSGVEDAPALARRASAACPSLGIVIAPGDPEILVTEVKGALERARARRGGAEAARGERAEGAGFEGARIGSWEWDVATGAVSLSRGLAAIHGLDPGRFAGTLEAYRLLVHPDDLPAIERAAERAVVADEEYEIEYRVFRPDGELRWLESRGRVERDASGRALRILGVCADVTKRKEAEREREELLDREREARASAERTQRRLALLVETSEALASAPGVPEALERLARLAVPEIADWCIVYLRDESDGITRAALEHADPSHAGLARRIAEGFELDPDSPEGVPKVIRTGEAALYSEASAELLASDAKDSGGLLALIRPLGVRSWICAPLVARGRTLGAISFISTSSGRRYGPGDLALAEVLALRAALLVDNVRLYEAERVARDEGDQTQRRLAFLAAATEALTASLDYAETLKTVARLAVPHIADWCFVDELRPDGELERLVTAHADPERIAWAEQLRRRYPPRPQTDVGPARVVRTGRPEIYPVIPQEALDSSAQDEEHRRLIAEMGIRSIMVVPIATRRRTIGAITFISSTSGRRYRRSDLAFAEELARRAAMALDNALLFEAERAARERSEMMHERLAFLDAAGAVLASSLDYERTLADLARHIVPRMADWCAVDVLGDDGALRRLAVEHVDPAKRAWALELVDRYPPDPAAPVGAPHVISTGRPDLLRDIPDKLIEAGARDPEHLRLMREIGLTSMMVVPLTAGGRTFGAITLVSAESGRHYDEDDLSFAEALAYRAALAVENASLFTEARDAEQRYRGLVDSTDAIVWEAEAGLERFTFVSRRAEELLGHPIRRWLGEPGFWRQIVHADDQEVALEAFESAATGGKRDIEFRALAADGRTVWLRCICYGVRDPTGRPALHGLMVDTTERKIREQRQEAQFATVKVLSEAGTLEEAAPRILRALGESLGWEFGALWTEDQLAGVLRCRLVWQAAEGRRPDFEELTRAMRFRPGIGLPGRVWESGRAHWIPDVAADDNFPRARGAQREGLHGAFGFPIESHGRVVGIVEFFADDIREPDENLLRMVTSIGAQVGQFMERKWAEEEVRFQRTLLQSQSEATIDGILAVSPEGRILYTNRRFREMWGIPDEVVATNADSAALESVLDRLVDPEGFLERVTFLYEHPDEESRDEIHLVDGRIFDRWTAALRDPNGLSYGRAWYFRDVTEQKRAEQALQESKERAAFLSEASSILASSLDYTTTLRAIARLTVPTLADWCVVDIVGDDGSVNRMAVAHQDPAKQELAESIQIRAHYQIDPEAPRGVPKVLRTGEPEMATTIEDSWLEHVTSRDLQYLELLRALGFKSYICVPMVARGKILGAITLVTAESDRRYSTADLALAEELGRRSALAIDNARLYHERAYVARTLQESLLPPHLPEIPGVEVASCYRAAGEGNEVGGDFYDVFHVGGRSWAAVMGDVCGKGADAAAVTALARYTLRAASMQARRPRKILGLLNEAMVRQRDDQRFCTVAYARLEPTAAGSRVAVASGGHPLPLVVRVDGRVESAGIPGTLLGVFPEPELHDYAFEMAPGDALVLYTDGVVEARFADEVFGEERLRELLRSCAGREAAETCQLIEHAVLEFQQGNPRDDIAILVVRIRA